MLAGPRLSSFVLAAIAMVCLVRGIGLARGGWGPSAEGERRWFDWAYGDAAFVRPLEALSEVAPRGRPLFLIVPERDREARWTGWYPVLARYYLPFNPIAGVGEAAQAPVGVLAVPLEAVSEGTTADR